MNKHGYTLTDLKHTGFKEWIEGWKPIHLCWLFDRYGMPIPKYLIGGGSKPGVYASGNIDNATRNLGNTVNVPVAAWDTANDFIVAIALESQSGANWTNTNYRLEWRNKTDGGTFAVLSGSGELAYGSTDLVEGNSLDSGEAICTPVNGTTYIAGSPNGGVEKEGAATFTAGSGGDANQWSEFQFSVDASNALGEKEYEFQIFDVDNSTALGPSLATITMAAVAGENYQELVEESLGITDTDTESTGFVKTLSESLGVTDAIVKSIGFVKSIPESMGVADNFTRIATYARSIPESLGITDAILKAATYIRLISESLGITDSIAAIIKLFVSINDTLGITDTFSRITTYVRAIPESLGITDSISRVATYIKLFSESLGVSDVFSRITTYIRSLPESLGITDTSDAEKSTGGEDFFELVEESMGVTDSTGRVAGYIRSVLENLGITDSISRVTTYIRLFSDSLGITDAVAAIIKLFVSISDSLGITDSISRVINFGKTINETLGITDSFSRAVTYIRSFLENMGLTDAATTIGGASGLVQGPITIIVSTRQPKFITETKQAGFFSTAKQPKFITEIG